MIIDGTGNLYGTTDAGGPAGDGIVFELVPSNGNWTEIILHSFTGNDGAFPGGVSLDGEGNLHGTANGGGAYGDGTVFKLMPSDSGWTESTLHSFTGIDGNFPTAGVIIDSVGNIYGTTYNGGASGNGVVFEVTGVSSGAPEVGLSSPYIFFPSAGSTSLTVTNSGTETLSITANPSIAGFNFSDFVVASSTTCTQGANVAPGASCVINVAFTPLTDSAESATLSLSDNASGSPQTIPLSGGAPLASILPNPVLGSGGTQTVTVTGSGFNDGEVLNWLDLANGETGVAQLLSLTPNQLTASVPFANATSTWQIQVTNSGAPMNCDQSGSPFCYSFEVLGGDYPYVNDYPFQNASYCPTSVRAKDCAPDTDDPYDFFFRECTSFVTWRMNRDGGTPDPRLPSFFNSMGGRLWGAATNWAENAGALGFVVNGSNPKVGDIAQWKKGECGTGCPGHVAYVESVNPDGSVAVSEYNYAGDDRGIDHQFGFRPNSQNLTEVKPSRFIHIQRLAAKPTALQFGSQAVGLTSSQSLTLTNTTGALISTITTSMTGRNSSDFIESGNGCASGILAGGSCQITVTFTPSSVGPRLESLTLQWNGGTQVIPITGTGLAGLTPSPKTLSFGNVPAGTSASKVVTLTNNTGADVTISSYVATGAPAFEQTASTCGSILKWKSSCTVTIAFSPTAKGNDSGTFEITDNAINSPQSVTLKGKGIGT